MMQPYSPNHPKVSSHPKRMHLRGSSTLYPAGAGYFSSHVGGGVGGGGVGFDPSVLVMKTFDHIRPGNLFCKA